MSRPSNQLEVEAADRRRAVEDLDHNLFVEAGAGTGKTTILVNRLVNIVRSGRARLTEVAAITFTEKAAGELLERVREGLEKAREGAEGEERARFEEALSDLERAPISTIHSFASQLLGERPVEAALDPRFRTLDEVTARFAIEEAWEAWLPAALDRDPAPLRRALLAGAELKSVRVLAELLFDHRDRLPPALPSGAAIGSGSPDLHGLVRTWGETQDRLDELVPYCREPEDRALEQISAAAEMLAEARRHVERDDREHLESLLLRVKIKSNAGVKKNWSPSQRCTDAKELLHGLKDRLSEAAAAIGDDICRSLLAWLGGFAEACSASFREKGWLTFQDLLIECRDLLRRDLEVRGYFQRRFRFILLDEFQDTDPLQIEIAFFLAEKEPRASSWTEVDLAPGKLFIVGDPKQSIYRFRRADIELYQMVRKRIEASGKVLYIRRNFRSIEPLVDWFNGSFGELIRRPEDGDYQPDYVPLLAGAEETPLEGPAVLDLVAAGEEGPGNADETRREEARQVAYLLHHMVSTRGEMRWGDIAVLFPKTTGMVHYEEALRERGIPFHLDGGREFFRRQEVAGILNCLEALDRPDDRIALTGALKSAAFGHTDEELLAFIAGGGRLSYLPEPPPDLAQTPLASTLAFLRRLHFDRNRLSPAAVLSRLIDDTGAAAAAALRSFGGLSASQNLKKLLALGRRFDEDGQSGAAFGRLARWLRRMQAAEAMEAESPTFEDKEDAVRLLTIHKSKGLQFPVVVLINLASDDKRKESFLWNGSRLEVHFSDSLQTLGFEATKEREKPRQEAERIRLLYVAATRARRRLVISRIGDSSKGDLKILAGRPGLEDVRPPAIPPRRAAAAAEAREWSERVARAAREITERPARIAADYRPQQPVSPSEAGTSELEWPWPSGAPGPGAQAARAFGTAVHRLLESVELDAPEAEVRRLAERIAAEEGIAPRARDVAADALRALRTPVLEQARRSPRVRREMPLLALLEGEERPVSGKIDLVFDEDGGWTIVDYKTDRVKPAGAAARAALYRDQIHLYSRAVEKLTSRLVRRAVVVFTAVGEEHQVDLRPR